MQRPYVSVIMPVYNSGIYIKAAVDSVLQQTFEDFELIVVDDGSDDSTAQRVQGMINTYGQRIRLIRHQKNRGIAAATNTGFEAARGMYIAPMDHDDVAMPDRLAIQVSWLEAHPHEDGCGALYVVLKPAWLNALESRWKVLTSSLVSAEHVACAAMFGGFLFNPTMCFRRRLLDLTSQWNGTFTVGGDDEFYERLLAGGARLSILPQVVLRYRRHGNNASRRHVHVARTCRARTACQALLRLMPDATEEEMTLHQRVVLRDSAFDVAQTLEVQQWFRRIMRHNSLVARYEPEALKAVLARNWHRVCAIAMCRDWHTVRAYRSFEELAPYLSLSTLLYQWQKRKIRYSVS